MGVLAVSYSDITISINNLKGASKQMHDYSNSLEKRVCRKISNLKGGESNYTSSANWFTNRKIKELRDKADRADTFAKNLGDFAAKVKETDETVKRRFEILVSNFKKEKHIKVNPVREWFVHLGVGFMNSTGFGRWVNNTFNKIGDFIKDVCSEIRYRYRCKGGKYWVDICISILAICGAIVVLCTAGAGFFALIASIGAVLTLINEVNNIITSGRALAADGRNPAWAARWGKMDKVSDRLRDESSRFANFLADILDGTEAVVDLVGIAKIGNKFMQSSKYTTAFKNLFGDKKSGLGSKFLSNNVNKKKYVVSWKGFKEGMKTLKSDKLFRKELYDTFKKDIKIDRATFKASFSKAGIKAQYKYFKSTFAKGKDISVKAFSKDPKERLIHRELVKNWTKTNFKKNWDKTWEDYNEIKAFNGKGKLFNKIDIHLPKYVTKGAKIGAMGDEIYKNTEKAGKLLFKRDITQIKPFKDIKTIGKTFGIGKGISAPTKLFNIFIPELWESQNYGIKNIRNPGSPKIPKINYEGVY